MFQLSPDENFHFELLRVLALARYWGSDISEVLQVASQIVPGDFESWYTAFVNLARRVASQADVIDISRHAVSARDACFRASTYFRAADFYLHGNPTDSRIHELWQQQTRYFNKALSLLPIPGKRIVVKGDGFDVPTIFYEPWGTEGYGAGHRGAGPRPRPTIVIGGGFDSAQEESMHVNGFAALERGYNVITYEGPGQPTVRREQGLGFIHDWEKAVSPVLDYYLSSSAASDPTHPASLIDPNKVGLIGSSMGGYLTARAAAFESHRLAGVILVDGVYSLAAVFDKTVPQKLKDQMARAEGAPADGQNPPSEAQVGAAIEGLLKQLSMAFHGSPLPTKLRWGVTHGMWSFKVASPAEYVERFQLMSMEGGLAEKINCPVWVGEASNDVNFSGQPEKLTDAINRGKTKKLAKRVVLTDKDAAGEHCHVGAACLLNQLIFDWFEDVANIHD